MGRLGWSLRRIQEATGIRRETASEYLKQAGIDVRNPGGWGRRTPASTAAKPVNDALLTLAPGVIPDSGWPTELVPDSKPAIAVIPDSVLDSKPAIEVIPDLDADPPKQITTASASEPYREMIEQGLAKGRNAKGIW